jgi:cell division protein FtsL
LSALAHIPFMRTLLVLLLAGAAGAAQAQVYNGQSNALTEHRLQMERDRIAADFRTLQAAQSRIDTAIERQRVEAMVRTPSVALTPLPEPDTVMSLPAPFATNPVPAAESRARTDELRALEMERRLQQLRSGL